MPNLKFLVVEDDLFYQTYVNDLLAETGVDIINAQDGEAGLSMALAERPDLILTDIEIPRIQGFVLFKMLREREETRDIPVIMMSGKVEKALLDRHSRLSSHAQGYLVKPFSGQVLIDMIRDVVGEDFGFSEVVIPPDGQDQDAQPASVQVDSILEISQFPEDAPEIGTGDGQITVLVVDDSKYICDITRDFLEELGTRVETASEGESGYKMASDRLPDLVLLDVQMPNLNGFVVCEMLRKQEETKNIPIILMSAVVDDESFERHSKLRYRADAYLQKPFMKAELHELVRRFTSLGDEAATDVESKTGFFVPPEDTEEAGGAAAAMAPAADPKLAAELDRMKLELEEKGERETRLETDLEEMRKAKDQLEAEIFEMRKTVEGQEGGLHDKLTLATQRFEEARAQAERLAEENRELQEKLHEAASPDEGSPDFTEIEEKLKEAHEQLNASMLRNQELEQKVKEVESSEGLKVQLSEMGARLQEANAAALDLENRNKLLEEEVRSLEEKDVSEEDAQRDREELQEKIEALQRDLTAAIAAKSEIEEQAKSLLEIRESESEGEAEQLRETLERSREENQDLVARISDMEAKINLLEEVQSELETARSEAEELRNQRETDPDEASAELAALKDKLSAAEKRAQSLEEKLDSQPGPQEDLEELRSRNRELESLTEELQRKDEESRKLAASETESRMDLEGQLKTSEEEKKQLVGELEETRRRLEESEEAEGRIVDLENRLEAEKELRDSAEGEIEALSARLEESGSGDEKVLRLAKDNKELKDALRESQERCEQLEKDADETTVGQADEDIVDGAADNDLDVRLNQLENALGKTVREAQTILKEQKDKESALEESVDSLMRSLEEERSSYRKDREAWSAKEGELRDAFEDALKESRRLMGEEAARFYPMHVPGRRRPLEVVTRTSRYGLAAAAAAAAIVLFAGGYFAKSKFGSTAGQSVVSVQSRSTTAPELQAPYGQPPEPWIARAGPEETYEELWRRNTVQSVSDDMLIQATLHTREELEAAINYTAVKEGWTRERIQKSMADMARTYNLSGSYYITVYSKNLKSGYPGYADNFERHIALRDHSGREARARLPGELEGSKFITSRVSAAGKEMNPVFLYEVGLTVAFSRKELAGKPEGLQLVLYDIGAVPMRVLTWDMSVMGSLS